VKAVVLSLIEDPYTENKGKGNWVYTYLYIFIGSHSVRSGRPLDHTVLPANYTIPACTSEAFSRWCHCWL